MKPAICIENLHFSYSPHVGIFCPFLEVASGEFLGIIGPNGGGKTTFLKLLMGLLPPSKGSITLLGQSSMKARTRIGYVPQVFQSDRAFPITLWQVVLLGALSQLSRWGRYPKTTLQQAEEWIDHLHLTPYKQTPFTSLSGGLAQRALLARALLSDPAILLLDEPTASIDSSSTEVLFQTLESLRGKKTILLVTHQLETVVQRVERILCIQKHVQSYTPAEICKHFALGLYHSHPTLLPQETSHAPLL